MAVARRMPVSFHSVFPAGAYLVGPIEAVADFDAPKREDGSRPQARDKETGQLVWSVPVLDADPEAGKKDKTLNVKVLADVHPVTPENTTPFPFTPVEFEGLQLTAYVEETGQGRSRVAWSIRATDVIAPKSRAAAGKGGE